MVMANAHQDHHVGKMGFAQKNSLNHSQNTLLLMMMGIPHTREVQME